MSHNWRETAWNVARKRGENLCGTGCGAAAETTPPSKMGVLKLDQRHEPIHPTVIMGAIKCCIR